MRIAVTGSQKRIQELTDKISSNHELIEVKNNDFSGFDLVFDLNFDDYESRLALYADLQGTTVIASAVKMQLEAAKALYGGEVTCNLVGINAIPGFINRELAELTLLNHDKKSLVENAFDQLNWRIKWVESRVGMVTPRVIFMIINEAYFTVQEGTASKEDINTGMKLGTAYPKGPFEWVEEIGIKDVYEVLDALYNDTRDERYKICPLLKTEYLNHMTTIA